MRHSQRLSSLGIVAVVSVSTTCSSTFSTGTVAWMKPWQVYGFTSKIASFHKNLSSNRRLSTTSLQGNINPKNNKINRNMSHGSVIPRAAVSVVVRSPTPSYILVQRGKEPNMGLWSLPGGKLEAGEPTLEGSKRELWEECQLDPSSLIWYADGAVAVTDSIHYINDDDDDDDDVSAADDNDNDDDDDQSNRQPQKQKLAFHYVIAQCFAQAPSELPLVASDDAADAAWQTLDQIRDKVEQGQATPGILGVIERVERMHQAGLLGS